MEATNDKRYQILNTGPAHLQKESSQALAFNTLAGSADLYSRGGEKHCAEADQVVVIQPWFNLLAAAVWRDDRDVSMQDSIDEARPIPDKCVSQHVTTRS